MPPAAPNESLPGEPTNLQRRQNADNDTENRNNSGDRRAENIRAHHQNEIENLKKEIRVHEAIVDQQDKVLSGELDANTPLPAGTDIAARFRQGEDGGDGERPPATVNELRSQREQARREREGNDDKSDTSNDTSDTSDNTSTEPVSTPATPVSDDAPKQDEAKLDDATAPDATKPAPKTPTPPSNRDTK